MEDMLKKRGVEEGKGHGRACLKNEVWTKEKVMGGHA